MLVVIGAAANSDVRVKALIEIVDDTGKTFQWKVTKMKVGARKDGQPPGRMTAIEPEERKHTSSLGLFAVFVAGAKYVMVGTDLSRQTLGGRWILDWIAESECRRADRKLWGDWRIHRTETPHRLQPSQNNVVVLVKRMTKTDQLRCAVSGGDSPRLLEVS